MSIEGVPWYWMYFASWDYFLKISRVWWRYNLLRSFFSCLLGVGKERKGREKSCGFLGKDPRGGQN